MSTQALNQEQADKLMRIMKVIEDLAFRMPAPNSYTPQIVELCIAGRDALASLDAAQAQPEQLAMIPACGDSDCWLCDMVPVLPASKPASRDALPLYGRWHHGNGVLVSGSLRVARADFDTNPSPEFQAEIFDWMCATLNAALQGQPAAASQEPSNG